VSKLTEYIQQLGTVFEDFSDNDNWTVGGGGSIVEDDVNVLNGTSSIKLTTASNTMATLQKTFTATSMREIDNRTIALHVDDPTKISAIRYYVGSTIGYNNAFSWGIDPAYLVPGWNFFKVHKNYLTNENGNSTWNNTMAAELFHITPTTGEIAEITIDSIIHNQKTTPKILFTFDDSIKSQYDYVFPLMESYGWKGTLYTQTDRIGLTNNLSEADIIEMYDVGWDSSNHTNTHPNLTTLIDELITNELTINKDWHIEHGLTRGIDHFAPPGGQWTQHTLELIKSLGYKTQRVSGSGYNLAKQSTDQINRLVVARGCASLGDQMPTILADVDRCVLEGNTLILMMHDFVDTTKVNATDWVKSDFVTLLDYIKQYQITPVTISEWYNGMSKNEAYSIPHSRSSFRR
jgi:peptidoglycan/xylan/chitin deacetylase (PgdA/CDA1 family)